MRINLAFANITHSRAKAALALAGIGVAIVLVFMQLGFRGAVADTAVNIYQRLDFDLLIRSRDYLHFTDNGMFARSVLLEIEGLDGVIETNELLVAMSAWQVDYGDSVGQQKGLLLMGINPNRPFFTDDSLNEKLNSLVSIDSILIDDKTHLEFGPQNGVRFSQADIGRSIRVSGNPIIIRDIFSLGAGLAANGSGIVSHEGFRRVLPLLPPDQITFGLVRVSNDSQPAEIARSIRAHFSMDQDSRLPANLPVDILTRQEVLDQELTRWLQETPIGFIFNLGVLIALIVGGAIVYMVLSTDVSDRLHEYATLRAMGYTQFDLSAIVIRQAIYLALFAFVPAVITALALYGLTSWLANIELQMSLLRIGLVFGLTMIMSCLSGGLALRKLWQAAPADLF